MSTVQAEIEIDAPIEKVWETVMDPHRLGDWVTIHKSVENVSPIPLRRGATMDQAISVVGITFHVHWRLTEVTEPTEARWEGGGPAHSDALIHYRLDAHRFRGHALPLHERVPPSRRSARRVGESVHRRCHLRT